MEYKIDSYQPLDFSKVRGSFIDQSSSPSAFLEQCLSTIKQRESTVQAWVILNEIPAREAAAESDERYKKGKPLSLIDGMPIGIKDLIETKDMPTQMGSPAFVGNYPKRDSALVGALRDAGAIIIGKTVTTALGFLDPGPTTNAFDRYRTPGGSSSGSGAAVGANMVPVAIGSQLVGSVLRPASFNANWALKPTFGAINRGERLGYSQSHVGVHAGSVHDMWRTAMEIVLRVGGDPGHLGLLGSVDTPPPIKPQRLAVIEGEGWKRLDASSRAVFNIFLDKIQARGIELVRRQDSPLLESLEYTIGNATELSLRLIAWEQRWVLQNLTDQHPDKLGPSLVRQLMVGDKLTLEDYRRDLALRQLARDSLHSMVGTCDAFISLSSCGPAPRFDQAEDSQYPTGDVSFSCISSLLGAPAISIPLLEVDSMPVGIQLIGQPHEDERLVALARGLSERE